MRKFYLSLQLFIGGITVRAEAQDFCVSDKLQNEFLANSAIKILEDIGDLQLFEVKVPQKMEGVEFSSATLIRNDEGEETLRVGINTSEVKEYPNSVISWVSISTNQAEHYLLKVYYFVHPIYPDACSYSYEIAIKT